MEHLRRAGIALYIIAVIAAVHVAVLSSILGGPSVKVAGPQGKVTRDREISVFFPASSPATIPRVSPGHGAVRRGTNITRVADVALPSRRSAILNSFEPTDLSDLGFATYLRASDIAEPPRMMGSEDGGLDLVLPQDARGLLTCTLFIDADGTVAEISIDAESFGQVERGWLDSVKIELKKLRFIPGRDDNGVVKSRVKIQLDFDTEIIPAVKQ